MKNMMRSLLIRLLIPESARFWFYSYVAELEDKYCWASCRNCSYVRRILLTCPRCRP